MTVTRVWVLGRGGLLGSAVGRALAAGDGAAIDLPGPSSWDDAAGFANWVRQTASTFAKRLQASPPGEEARWAVLWAAGQGTMGSRAEDMERETTLLSSLLDALTATPELRRRPGAFVFSSTAGGIYAGSTDETITERSAPKPTGPYGEHKLKQEQIVAAWARTMPEASVLLARISTLYGPGQSARKRQGLISHIARSLLRQQPVHIYVPLDTMRDYLYADDAARDVLDALGAVAGTPGITTKIVAAEQATTVAQIIGTFEQIMRRMPRVITSAHPLGAQYRHRMCFRSEVHREARTRDRTSLLVGISAVMAQERLAFAVPG